MAELTAAQLLHLIHQQQTQISQLLTLQQNAQQAAPAQQSIIPALPDISIFEPSDEKSRISEWLERFKFGLDCAAPNADDAAKVKALMNKLSEAAFSEYTKFCLPAAVTAFSFDETISKLEKLFAKPQSIFIDRYECLMACRGEGEDFRQFINRHKRLLADFQFKKLKEEQFKGLMLLTALKSPRDAALRQRILTKLTADGDRVKYDEIVDDCINYLTTIAEAKIIESSAGIAVNAMKKRSKGHTQEREDKANVQDKSPPAHKCWRCGGNHSHAECRHKSSKCNKCSQFGHLQSKCDNVQEWRRKNGQTGDRKNVSNIVIGTALKAPNSTSLLKIAVKINNKPVNFVLDSGTEVNIIDEGTYMKIGSPKIRNCTEKGTLFDGTQRSFIGKGSGTFEFNGTKVEHDFYVAKKGALNLLSIQMMDSFGLLDGIKRKINGQNFQWTKDDRKGQKGTLPKNAMVAAVQMDARASCQLAAKATAYSWPKATKPWQRIHIDYAGPFYGKDYLIVVDAYSKYPEVFEMATRSTAATIAKLRYLFSRHGLPEVLVSDKGTQFTSSDFAEFMQSSGIVHLYSAPYNPMSNGQAERFVDTFKRAFKKLKGEGAPSTEIIETFLVTYRATPNDSLPDGKSPAEVFLGRKIRTTLDFLNPPPKSPTELDKGMERRFNRRFGTNPREFGIGDKVFARQRISQCWRPGNIAKRTGVFYDVCFFDGTRGRFHANQIGSRNTADHADHLEIFHEVFNLPAPAKFSSS